MTYYLAISIYPNGTTGKPEVEVHLGTDSREEAKFELDCLKIMKAPTEWVKVLKLPNGDQSTINAAIRDIEDSEMFN